MCHSCVIVGPCGQTPGVAYKEELEHVMCDSETVRHIVKLYFNFSLQRSEL